MTGISGSTSGEGHFPQTPQRRNQAKRGAVSASPLGIVIRLQECSGGTPQPYSLHQRFHYSAQILLEGIRNLRSRISAMLRKSGEHNSIGFAVQCQGCLAAGNPYCYNLTDDCRQYIELALSNRPWLSPRDLELLIEGWHGASAMAFCSVGKQTDLHILSSCGTNSRLHSATQQDSKHGQ
jgi:hypothetical protein